LPEPAQPWAREVQKQLTNVITSDQANEVNNAARDNQLNSSLISLTKVVSDVKTASAEATSAINGLTGLGSTGSSYTINASNINGGTITGVTVQTGSSGQRIVLSGTTLDFYSPGGTYSGRLIQEGGDAVPSVNMESSSGSNYVQVWNSGARMVGDGSSVTAFSGQVYLAAGLVSTSSSFTSGGSLTSNSSVFFPSLSSTTSAANVRVGTGGGGQLFVVTSARKYKIDIQDIEVGLGALQLKPRTWIDKGEYERNGNSANGLTRIPGFVAEEVLEAGLDEFILYDEVGEIQGLSYDRMLASVIPVIKDHNDKITELSNRITALENGA
jgi:hypothetical protein